MGRSPRRPDARDLHGVVLLDKPAGLSSNQAMQRVRRALNARKAGHTGNLDVAATGLLPICLGEATKFSGQLLDADKVYRAHVQFGVTTRTGDAEGEVVETRPVQGLEAPRLQAEMARLTGPIEQVPPMYSALKKNGQPLYALARAGKVVERTPRRVTIFRFELLSLNATAAEVEVACSKGTYIRTLAEDLGAALGCGAHLTALRRLASGPFRLEDAHTVEAIEAACLAGTGDGCVLPVDTAVSVLPALEVSDTEAEALRHGRPVRPGGPGSPATDVGEQVRIYGPGVRFLGLGECAADGQVLPRRIVNLME